MFESPCLGFSCCLHLMTKLTLRFLIRIANQFGHAPVGQFAEGTTSYHTWRVVVCRPSAYSPGGATAN